MSTLLFISNLTNNITSFSSSSIHAAQKMGMNFIHAANWSDTSPEHRAELERSHNIKICSVPINRSPFSFSNITAFKQLCRIVKENNVDYIHCNTPVGGLLGRLVGKKCKVKIVLYQAHGFHFYEGAPLKNWLLFFPIERFLAHFTDTIITINKEDYVRAKRNFVLRNHGKVYYVPGVGIDLSQYRNNAIDRNSKRKSLNIIDDDVVLISAGELNENKNNRVIIEAMRIIDNPRLHYLVCGKGALETELKSLVKKYGLEKYVHFLGYRTDIKELLSVSDIFVMPSFREGLSRSIMEAMACGLPCIASKIRGNMDLLEDGIGGFLCAPDKPGDFAEAIKKCDEDTRRRIRDYNLEAVKQLDIHIIEKEIERIYRKVFIEEQ